MKKYIYINAAREKFYVSDEDYSAFYKEVDAKRKREQYHHRCVCPKEFIRQCDGDCDICRYHRSGDMYSLDYKNEVGKSLMDTLPENKDCWQLGTSDVEQLVIDSILLRKLIEKLCELDADGAKMIEIWKENPKASDREIARQLGRKQRTFANQIKRIREILKNDAQEYD